MDIPRRIAHNCRHHHRIGLFVLAGVLQWLVDSAVMVLLSHGGMDVALATLCGRLAGAACGFAFNARITFAADDARPARQALPRFVLFWLAATATSAWLLSAIDAYGGLHLAWIFKPLVDALLAVIGYRVSRHWIYRDGRQ